MTLWRNGFNDAKRAGLEGFTPLRATPPNGPLVGLMPVASLEEALELIA